jgi:phage-related protein
MWGPIGSLIAGLVNFLRMSPEEMDKFITDLNQAAIDMVKNIATNLGTIFEKTLAAAPEIFASIVGVLFDINTYRRIGEGIVNGIKEALKGVVYWFKRMMFGSKEKSPYEKSLADQTKKNEELLAAAQKATFGSKEADAGEGRFKIKDVTESTQAGSLALVQQTLVETADEAGMSFGEQMMKYAMQFVEFITNGLKALWDWVVDLVGKLWEMIKQAGKIISDIWEGLKDLFAEAWKLLGSIGEALKSIWDGLVDVISKTWESIKTIGSTIWEGLKSALKQAWDTYITLGSKIWEGLKSGISTAWEWLKSIGTTIWNALSDGMTKAWEMYSSIGQKIWNGLVSAVSSMPTFFQTLGSKIWNGLTAGFAGIPTFFESIGAKIWNGLSASISMKKFTEAGQTLYNGFFDLLNKGWINFTSAGGNIWVAFKNGIIGAWSWISSIGGRIWEGLKQAAGGGAGNEIGGTLGTVANAIKSGLGMSSGGDITSSMGNPSLAMMFSAMGALRAAEGIDRVPGVGISDTVPILARAGERVLTPQQARAMDNGAGSITLNITLNAPAGSSVQKTDIKQMGEQIIDYIRRESKNGRNILRPSGVY